MNLFKRIVMIDNSRDETGAGAAEVGLRRQNERRISEANSEEGFFLAPSGAIPGVDPAEADDRVVLGDGPGEGGEMPDRRSFYEREWIESVWQFAETVPGTDPALWRRDEFGAWIRRLDYGVRTSKFGWEIFDPGSGRHNQGVYAMRPMQWESYIRQYEAFS